MNSRSARCRQDDALAVQIAAIAARLSRTGANRADPALPFALMGLDSLGTIELASAVEDELGVEIPAAVVGDCVDSYELADRIAAASQAPAGAGTDRFELMLADAQLPDEIRPSRRNESSTEWMGGLRQCRNILLTGATGFLGSSLAARLLESSAATLICVVRAGALPARDRLQSALAACGASGGAISQRVQVVGGDLSEPLLGLGGAEFDSLGRSIDAVCHVGASVNWIEPYESLRRPNVGGTCELLRLAVLRDVPFHFISSLAVCYSTTAPREVDEEFDPLIYVGGNHLGYAQSKSVAEALVREAARRGLPAAIYRPALIVGDSVTGRFNRDDLLSLLVKGCIRMNCAPDLDWSFDALPVDVAAERILALSQHRGIFHLAHPRPRHWRECVLWMRLFGYPVTLVPYHAWLKRLERDLAAATVYGERHPLRPLRQFLFDRPQGADGLTLPELYERSRRPDVRTDRTSGRLIAGAPSVELDAALLETYFNAFLSARHIEPPPEPSAPAVAAAPAPSKRRDPQNTYDLEFFRRALDGRGHGEVVEAIPRAFVPEHSIVSDLTGWLSRRPIGLFRYALTLRTDDGTERREVILKAKPRDVEALAVGQALADLCDRRVGHAYAEWRDRIGISQSHKREIAVYQSSDRRFTRHAPAVLGLVDDDPNATWALVLECVADAAVKAGAAWNDLEIVTAIDGLAALQSIWYGRTAELEAQPWLGYVQTTECYVEMCHLWEALADQSRQSFGSWAGASIGRIHRVLVASAAEWRRDLDRQPRTLIHNDFNPRNVCVRRGNGGLTLCAYDWELATIGAPQRDLAEFLCFALPAGVRPRSVARYVERHREALEREAAAVIDAGAWHEGFRAALYDVLVSRLAMYALIDRVKPQPFLPRVVGTWKHLYDLFPFTGTR